jgi:hypothetical protein
MNLEPLVEEPRVYIVVTEDGRIVAIREDLLFVHPDGSLSISDPPVPVVLLSENEVDDA